MPALLQITFILAVIAGSVWLISLPASTMIFLITGMAIVNFLLFPFTLR